MGIQDHIVTIGAEAVAFGTKAATLTRGIEQLFGAEPTPNYEQRPREGMRPSSVAMLDSQMVTIARNGKYPLEVDLMDKSHGLLLALLGSGDPAVTTPMGGTLTRLHTITPTTAGPTRSISVHNEIPEEDGGTSSINYLGCMAESATLSVAPKSNVKLKVDLDYKSDDLAASTVTPSYPSSPHVFLDTETDISLDGTSRCATKLDFTFSTGIKTDLDRICATGRRQPLTTGKVVCTGTVGIDYVSPALWAKWKAGTAVALTVTITGTTAIEGSLFPGLTLTCPSVRITGNAAQRQQADLTAQDVAFQVTYDGTNPPWKLEYQTTDTAP